MANSRGIIGKVWDSITGIVSGVTRGGQRPRYGGLSFGQSLATKPELSASDLVKLYAETSYYCANLNARGVASTRLCLYAKTGAGQRKPRVKCRPVSREKHAKLKAVTGAEEVAEVLEHPILDLLKSPSKGLDDVPQFSLYDLLELTQLQLEVIGRSYWQLELGSFGQPLAINALIAQFVEPRWLGTRDPSKVEWYDYYVGTPRRFELPEIIPFRFTDLRNPFASGYSPLQAACMSVMTEEQYARHVVATLANRARPDAMIAPAQDGGVISDAEAKRIEQTFNSKFRGDGTGGVYVAKDAAIKVETLSFSPKDVAEMSDRELAIKQVCRVFDVPVSMVDKDANRANATQGRAQHRENAIAPRCQKLQDILNMRLCPLYDDRLFLAFEDVVPEDEELLLKQEESMAKTSSITPNEIRASHGYEPVENGDVPLMPSTMVPLGTKPQAPQPTAIPRGSSAAKAIHDAVGRFTPSQMAEFTKALEATEAGKPIPAGTAKEGGGNAH